MSDMHTENTEDQYDGTTDTQETGEDGLTPDQRRIAQWHAAVAETPSEDDVRTIQANIKEAEDLLAAAQADYERAIAARGRVYGFREEAEKHGHTTKLVKVWWRRHLPDTEDLSTIPQREMAREEKRIAAVERRFAREQELHERVLAQKARLEEMKGGQR